MFASAICQTKAMDLKFIAFKFVATRGQGKKKPKSTINESRGSVKRYFLLEINWSLLCK